MKWIRIEAQWPNTTVGTYQSIVAGAHEAGIKVLCVLPMRYCGADNDNAAIDNFTSEVVNTLQGLTTSVFTPDFKVDAFEIGNELNIMENGCSDGQQRFRVSPNAFAWVMRRVIQWRDASSRVETIVSGGLLNTYTNEPFWPSFFSSGAFSVYPGTLPFDMFGVHPYNPYSIDTNCLNAGGTACFAAWGKDITSGLLSIATQLERAAAVDAGTVRLFVTEFGLTTAPSGTECSIADCVLNPSQQAAGMQTAVTAMQSSAAKVCFWYDWRDDAESFGLRSQWSDSLAKYPAKVPTWATFAQLAGGPSGSPDKCWQ